MKIYWTIASIPELAGLPREERGRIWREAYRKSFRERKMWLGLLACGLCAGAGSIVGDFAGHGPIGAVIGGGIGGIIFGLIATSAARPHIRAIIARDSATAAR